MWACVYLFLAFGVFDSIPAAFITFAPLPLYSTYELAPRMGTWTPLDDQQLAGALMKVGGMPILWTVIAVIFVRNYNRQMRDDAQTYAVEAPGDGAAGPGERRRSRPGRRAARRRTRPRRRAVGTRRAGRPRALSAPGEARVPPPDRAREPRRGADQGLRRAAGAGPPGLA